MNLNIRVEEQDYQVKVPDQIVTEASDYFNSLDQDMDKGWQMSRQWVDQPNVEQRCQIVADRILAAIDLENKKSLTLLSAYLVSKMPNIKTVDISTNGDMQETLFEF